MNKINVLLITNTAGDIATIEKALSEVKDTPYALTSVNSVPEIEPMVQNGGTDVIFLDLNRGINILEEVRKLSSNMPIITLIPKEKYDLGLQSIDSGANDYIIKENITSDLLASSLRYAMERNVLLLEMQQYATELLVNEERFRNLIAGNVDSMVVIDREKNVRFINKAAEKFFNKDSSEYIGKRFDYPIDLLKTCEVAINKGNSKEAIAEMRVVEIEWEREPAYLASLRDITDRKHAEEEKIRLIRELQAALTKVKTLSGLLPICAVCKKIRDDSGYWNQLEGYIQDHSSAEFSHGICPDCQKKLYPDIMKEKGKEQEK